MLLYCHWLQPPAVTKITSLFVFMSLVTLNAYLWYSSQLLYYFQRFVKSTRHAMLYSAMGVFLYGPAVLIPLTLYNW